MDEREFAKKISEAHPCVHRARTKPKLSKSDLAYKEMQAQ